jgi:hypothetical protein
VFWFRRSFTGGSSPPFIACLENAGMPRPPLFLLEQAAGLHDFFELYRHRPARPG